MFLKHGEHRIKDRQKVSSNGWPPGTMFANLHAGHEPYEFGARMKHGICRITLVQRLCATNPRLETEQRAFERSLEPIYSRRAFIIASSLTSDVIREDADGKSVCYTVPESSEVKPCVLNTGSFLLDCQLECFTSFHTRTFPSSQNQDAFPGHGT